MPFRSDSSGLPVLRDNRDLIEMTAVVVISKRKKLLRARAESPKIGACLGAAFYAVMRLRFYGRRNCTNQPGPSAPPETIFLLCKVALQQFRITIFYDKYQQN